MVTQTSLFLGALIHELFLIGKDLGRAQPAFSVIAQRRKLPTVLECFLGMYNIKLFNATKLIYLLQRKYGASSIS